MGTSPLRVAIVGAGPAGLYLAERLAAHEAVRFDVNIVDRLLTPFGLVRYGVAPDHPTIRSVITSLQEILERPNVRFFGGIDFGVDLDRSDFRRCCDVIVYATGARCARSLSIPGEDLTGSVSATDLVAWYNGHPDADGAFSLKHSAVAVLGAGNVALDVARMIVRQFDDLAGTDVPSPVLDRLRDKEVRNVYLIARRGPTAVKFSTKELHELGKVNGIDLHIDPADLNAAESMAVDRMARNNIKVMREWAARARVPGHRTIHFRFFERPVEVVGVHQVEAVRVERTRVDDAGEVRGTGNITTLPVGMVVRAVGYRGTPLRDVAFEQRTGTIRNHHGRIVDDAGTVVPCEYTVGWIKRGPSGVIGTNRIDAQETAEAILADIETGRLPTRLQLGCTLTELLAAKRIAYTDLAGWKRIDQAELRKGAAEGRLRSKIHDWPTLRELSRLPGIPAERAAAR